MRLFSLAILTVLSVAVHSDVFRTNDKIYAECDYCQIDSQYLAFVESLYSESTGIHGVYVIANFETQTIKTVRVLLTIEPIDFGDFLHVSDFEIQPEATLIANSSTDVAYFQQRQAIQSNTSLVKVSNLYPTQVSQIAYVGNSSFLSAIQNIATNRIVDNNTVNPFDVIRGSAIVEISTSDNYLVYLTPSNLLHSIEWSPVYVAVINAPNSWTYFDRDLNRIYQTPIPGPELVNFQGVCVNKNLGSNKVELCRRNSTATNFYGNLIVTFGKEVLDKPGGVRCLPGRSCLK